MATDEDGDVYIQLERPSEAMLLRQWTAFVEDPLLSMTHLKKQAVEGHVDKRGLRSLHWRYFFSLLPSPSPPISSTWSSYSAILSHSRSEYTELRTRYLISPDGGWVNDGASPSASPRIDQSVSMVGPALVEVQVNNPLGLDSGNPWSTWFDSLELRRTIRQDVKRTFPEIDYFRDLGVQDKMVDLLFIWCKLTPEIGYRQGMHELIAPLLWAVDFDSLSPPRFSDDDEDDEDDRSLAHLVLSRNHVEHDTWQLFSTLMKSAKAFYDFTPSVPQAVDSSKTAASAPSPSIPSSSSKTSAATAFGIPPASSSASVLVQPIVATAIRIHDGLLKTIDCALWAKLESLAIEPQLYALRWLRLLFSREFPMQDTMCLWDGLFAEDASSLRLMQHLCVAMLLRIRDALLEADYSETLQLLLRYPALPDGTHRVTQLLQQAVYLRDNVSAEAGERCRMQNRERGEVAGAHILGSGGMDTARRRPSSASSSHGHRNMSSMAPAMATSPGLLGDGGFVGDLAKGAYARAEALGINKALLGTFNEIKRSYAQAQAQAQAAQAARDRMSQIPNHQQHQHRTEARRPLPVASPPPAPALKDHLADMGQARSTNLAMSQALDLCINTLQHEVGGGGSEGPLAALTLSTQAMMALTALGHVRDVLAGKTRTFDASVLAPLRETLEAGQLAATASNEERDTASSDAASLIDVEPPSSIPITPFSQPQPLHRPSNGDARFHPSTVSSSASSSPSTSATPPLMLSTRSDKPLPSLTRVPQPSAPKSNAPAHSHSVPRTQTGADATNRLRDVPVMSFTSNRAGASASRPQPSSSNSTADPLGALL